MDPFRRRRALACLLFGALSALASGARAADPAPPLPDQQSDEAIQVRRGELRRVIDRLEPEVRRDIDHRLHLIAYEKCRTIEAALSEELALLAELKRREPSLSERIRIDREVGAVRGHRGEVRRMSDLLRLVAQR